ncbi:hypothetical protein J5N97_017344 [Dioscorea zingiberensis]|uniref:Pectinesterase n=1 Tax=Dioscorea zingiberensis TaxID=325984 RepID=A0A9D5HG96_9LILI|nr:hypothetical protein J5N97_017344 [Dioscorea zingiberensis]
MGTPCSEYGEVPCFFSCPSAARDLHLPPPCRWWQWRQWLLGYRSKSELASPCWSSASLGRPERRYFPTGLRGITRQLNICNKPVIISLNVQKEVIRKRFRRFGHHPVPWFPLKLRWIPGAGQAVAIRVTVDRCVFYNCRFLSWQDTLYLHHGKQYLRDCYIEGSVDFIFGNATALLEHCHIYCK